MKQGLEQKQLEVLQQIQTTTQQQVQLSHLLELPVSDLAEKIENELLENPALEVDTSEGETVNETDEITYNELDDYNSLDEVPDYLLERAEQGRVRRRNEDDFDGSYDFVADSPSAYDMLMEQVSEQNLNDEERQILTYLVGSLNDQGFLEKDDDTLCDELAFQQYIYTTPQDVHRLVEVLQTFEPTGIGAHSLGECLSLQLKAQNRSQAAIAIVETHFDDYAHKRWEKIKSDLQLTDDDLQRADGEIRRLNPRPIAALGNESQTATTVIPDFYVYVDESGEIRMSLNKSRLPALRVSESFQESLQTTAKNSDAYVYTRQHYDAATTFIESLRMREQALRMTMESIIRLQKDFFLNGDDESLLKPMALKDIAQIINMDVSTVSRVANSKYVQTEYGTYPLKYFFAAQKLQKDGKEVSNRQVKAALRQLIDEEDKNQPLTDDELVEKLKEQGYQIARRTVAKYRTQMGIPSTLMRR